MEHDLIEAARSGHPTHIRQAAVRYTRELLKAELGAGYSEIEAKMNRIVDSVR